MLKLASRKFSTIDQSQRIFDLETGLRCDVDSRAGRILAPVPGGGTSPDQEHSMRAICLVILAIAGHATFVFVPSSALVAY